MLAKLSLCRTHALGGRKFRCQDCGETSSRYNSCGDRHCPQCSGSKRVDFYEKASKLLLPGVVYYQVVFTLPSELSELALANRNEMADLLVGSAWKSLSRNIKDEQDYDPAAIMVLHTWNQKLDAHWHVHLLVPGEGPGIKRTGWKKSQAPPEARNSDGHYLVDADRLRSKYRQRAIARLKHLRQAGKLNLGGKFEHLREDENWDAFIKQMESISWSVHIQPPPQQTSSADQVVKYLARYLTGGPISDHRIVAADHREVRFLAREGVRAGGERKQVPITLSIKDFIQRWSLHIQPEQLTKTRYFGGWSNQRQAEYTSLCRQLLAEARGSEAEEEAVLADSIGNQEYSAEESSLVCPHCDGRDLEMISRTAKPSWKELLWRDSAWCPWWYSELQWADHRRFWTAEQGEDYYDWYLETQVEGAKESGPSVPQPIQLYLPGMTPRVSFELESF